MYAIVRHDPGSADVTLASTVVAVVAATDEAEREVGRRHEINREVGYDAGVNLAVSSR